MSSGSLSRLADEARNDRPQRSGIRAVPTTGPAYGLSVDSWRKLVELAAHRADAPDAIVSVETADQRLLISRIGPGDDAQRSDASARSLCRYAMRREGPVVVENTLSDPRLREEPAFAQPGVGAYAGHRVRAPGGQVIGALCVVDDRPRTWAPLVADALVELAAAAEQEVASSLPHVGGPATEDANMDWTPRGFMLKVDHPDGTLTTRLFPADAGTGRADGETSDQR